MSDLWTPWQLFPLDDDQTCYSKDWVGDWVDVELLYNSVKIEVRQLEIGRSYRRDVVGKATPGRMGPRDPRWSFGDQLVIRCCKESHHPAKSWAHGPPVEQQWRTRKTLRWRPWEWGSIYCSSVRSPAPSHTQTLSNPFRTLTIKLEVHIFLKKSYRVFIIVSLWCCIWEYNTYFCCHYYIFFNCNVFIIAILTWFEFLTKIILFGCSFPIFCIIVTN